MDPGISSSSDRPPVDPSQAQKRLRTQPLLSAGGPAPITKMPAEILEMFIAYLPENERSLPREISSWFRDNIAKPSKLSDTSAENPTRLKATHVSQKVLGAAARLGAIPFLDWAKEHQVPISNQVANEAALAGKLDVLKWTVKNQCTMDLQKCVSNAIQNGHIYVLEWLKNDRGCHMQTKDMHDAITFQQLEVMKWLKDPGGLSLDHIAFFIEAAANNFIPGMEFLYEECPWGEEVCQSAALNRSLEALQWLRAHGCPWDERTCLGAIEAKDLKSLAWAVNNGAPFSRNELLQRAVDADILRWLRKNTFAKGGQPDATESQKGILPPQELCMWSASAGNLEALKSARAEGCIWGDTAVAAARHGRLEVLQWAIAYGCPWDERVCEEAAEQGHFNLLIWALANGAPYDLERLIKSTASYPTMCGKLAVKAAKLGLIPLLDRMVETNRFVPSAKFCEAAASSGKLEALKWARSHGCPWGKALAMASKRGHWDLVKWAIGMGCPFNQESIYLYADAIEQGCLDIIKWLYEQDCPYENVIIFMTAAYKGDMEIVQWLHDRGFPSNDMTCAMAAQGGHLQVLQWMHKNGYKWSESTCSYAARGGYLPILQWARIEGCPWDDSTFISAAMHGQFQILRWLKGQGAPYNLGKMLSISTIKPEIKEWLRKNFLAPAA